MEPVNLVVGCVLAPVQIDLTENSIPGWQLIFRIGIKDIYWSRDDLGVNSIQTEDGQTLYPTL